MNKIIVELLIKWENLDQRDRMWKAFWPIMSNANKQMYYIKKHNVYILGDVDEILCSWDSI